MASTEAQYALVIGAQTLPNEQKKKKKKRSKILSFLSRAHPLPIRSQRTAPAVRIPARARSLFELPQCKSRNKCARKNQLEQHRRFSMSQLEHEERRS